MSKSDFSSPERAFWSTVSSKPCPSCWATRSQPAGRTSTRFSSTWPRHLQVSSPWAHGRPRALLPMGTCCAHHSLEHAMLLLRHNIPVKWDFPGGSDGEASAYSVGDPGSIPGSGRSSGEGNDNPLQYFCLESPKDGGAWWATVCGVAKSRTRLRDFTFTFHLHAC